MPKLKYSKHFLLSFLKNEMFKIVGQRFEFSRRLMVCHMLKSLHPVSWFLKWAFVHLRGKLNRIWLYYIQTCSNLMNRYNLLRVYKVHSISYSPEAYTRCSVRRHTRFWTSYTITHAYIEMVNGFGQPACFSKLNWIFLNFFCSWNCHEFDLQTASIYIFRLFSIQTSQTLRTSKTLVILIRSKTTQLAYKYMYTFAIFVTMLKTIHSYASFDFLENKIKILIASSAARWSGLSPQHRPTKYFSDSKHDLWQLLNLFNN